MQLLHGVMFFWLVVLDQNHAANICGSLQNDKLSKSFPPLVYHESLHDNSYNSLMM